MPRPFARFLARTAFYDEYSPTAYRVRRYIAHRRNHPER